MSANIRKYVEVIKRAIALIEQELEPQTVQSLAEPSQPVVSPTVDKEWLKARHKHIEDLKAIDCWPTAVPAFMAESAMSDDENINRANSVLDTILDRDVEDLTILDFGCGEGWITKELKKRDVKEVVGYDIVTSSTWAHMNQVKFFTSYSDLPKNHFDIVILYDVLDHSHNPIDVMQQVHSLLKLGGTVYVRCHPWTSKHAMHLFKQGVNKAYWHLFLTQEELERNHGPVMFTRKEMNPLDSYRWWFNNFDIKKEVLIKEPIHEFFFVPAFQQLLSTEQGVPLEQIDEFLAKLEIQFVDFKLVKK